jgi:hypothetical protein
MKSLAEQAQNRPLLFGLVLIALGNVPLYTTLMSVRWDTHDEMWTYFRWMGSALRQGYFPDFFPNIVAGYPLGANMQAGVYNVVYLAFATMFADSLWSINLLYVLTQGAVYCLTWAIAGTCGLRPISRVYFGLAMTISGFVVGHASHLSYLATACGLLSCLLGLRWLMTGRRAGAFWAISLGIYYMLTAGYPANILFGAQCLALYWVYLLISSPSVRRASWLAPMASLSGLAISAPAILHLLHQLGNSARGEGVSIDALSAGSMPAYSLLNYLLPWWHMRYSEPTMERFHLLWLSVPLTGYALWLAIARGNERRVVLSLFCMALVLIVLALGANSPLPIRIWLAEQSFLYRTGRFPAGEHRGIALFLLAWISAIGLNRYLSDRPQHVRIVMRVLVIEFVLGLYALAGTRWGTVPREQRGTQALIQALFDARSQSLIDAPRDCTPVVSEADWASPAIRFQMERLAPTGFSVHGYTNLKDRVWLKEQESASSILCGPSRLWRATGMLAQPYTLKRYTPGYISFVVAGPDGGEPLALIWADYNDGLWRLKINGEIQPFESAPARLRGFQARPGDQVEMSYLGPLSGLWRR